MFLDILLVFFYLVAPTHDFHTSWMNFTYDEKNKVFEGEWRTDTEHLEGVLNAFSNKEIHLENSSVEQHIELINNYINKNCRLQINQLNKALQVDIVEVNFAETVVHFKPIKQRKKMKSIQMTNTLLIAQFPNQKNMVQINYKGTMNSMLFDGVNTNSSLKLAKK